MTTTLIAEIEQTAARLGLEPSTVGRMAGQGGHFYKRLKDGKRVWPDTEAKVREFLDQITVSDASPLKNKGAA